MNAIQIKRISKRYLAFTANDEHYMEADITKSPEDNSVKAAHQLIKKLKWDVEISGEGTLPNGDYVVTLMYNR